ncbi:MAG TPA: Smr/MutS family protein [Candidatus Dormibacteraeota bacterium]|nr:Smr/MutS family protein [Candidatus Dormibacteraeota bacterium]
MPLDEIRRLIRETLGVMPTLDLHGLGVQAALRATERFLAEAQEQGLGSVRIVYGKGKRSPGGHGVLREVVPRWLDGDGRAYVRRWERRPDASGADGGMIVWVRELEDEDDEDEA